MDGDEHVRVVFARDVDTLAQRNEEVVVANEAYIKTLFALQALGEQLCDGQHDVFFSLTFRANGSRVFAPVAGVDDHHDVALGTVSSYGLREWFFRQWGGCG